MRKDFEAWLAGGEAEIADTRQRLQSLWLDMLHVIEQQEQRPGYAWQLAALAVWHAMPKRLREPRTETELAMLLGVDGRVLRRWRTRHPELFVHSAEQSAFNRLLRDVLPDVLDASVRCAVEDGAQGHQDRKLLLEMAGAYRAKAAPMLTSGVSVYLPDNHRG